MTHQHIFDLIAAERHRQDELKAMGRIAFTAADPIHVAHKAAMLAVKTGDLARLTVHFPTRKDDLQRELVQVAAVCLAWLETL